MSNSILDGRKFSLNMSVVNSYLIGSNEISISKVDVGGKTSYTILREGEVLEVKKKTTVFFVSCYKCSINQGVDFFIPSEFLELLIACEFVTDIGESTEIKEDEHSGMIFNPISKTWHWF
jgi:hypothetical protein